MSRLVIDRVTVEVAGENSSLPRRIVDDVSLSVGTGEVLALLGPSGSGKTTLLRVVAGLQEPDEGRVLWDETDLGPVPPHRRGFGLVFQQYALFGHRDVGANVEFGLRMAGVPKGERRDRTRSALSQVGLAGYESRKVSTLSGGEQQRVALARMLIVDPRLLMFDEPLGALDQQLRRRLVVELADTIRSTTVPALYVTHDVSEARSIATHLAVMIQGRVVQYGSVAEVLEAPSPEVAEFLGLD